MRKRIGIVISAVIMAGSVALGVMAGIAVAKYQPELYGDNATKAHAIIFYTGGMFAGLGLAYITTLLAKAGGMIKSRRIRE